MSGIGDGSGNEILVTGALFVMLDQSPGVIDVALPEGASNVVEFGLDFMKSRYRVTVTKVDDDD